MDTGLDPGTPESRPELETVAPLTGPPGRPQSAVSPLGASTRASERPTLVPAASGSQKVLTELCPPRTRPRTPAHARRGRIPAASQRAADRPGRASSPCRPAPASGRAAPGPRPRGAHVPQSPPELRLPSSPATKRPHRLRSRPTSAPAKPSARTAGPRPPVRGRGRPAGRPSGRRGVRLPSGGGCGALSPHPPRPRCSPAPRPPDSAHPSPSPVRPQGLRPLIPRPPTPPGPGWRRGRKDLGGSRLWEAGGPERGGGGVREDAATGASA